MNCAYRVYAIARRDFPVENVAAGHFSVMERIPHRDLAAIVERTNGVAARMSVDAVMRHQAIVEAVHLQAASLPVQFGAGFRDVQSIEAALERRYETLVSDLERIGDKVELSLTALWSDPLPDHEWRSRGGSTPGSRYLKARAAEVRRDDALLVRAKAVAAAIDSSLGTRALDRRGSLIATPGMALRTTYLLDPAEVLDFRAAFEAIRPERSEVRLLLTGPWPPYSFVTRTDRQAGRPD